MVQAVQCICFRLYPLWTMVKPLGSLLDPRPSIFALVLLAGFFSVHPSLRVILIFAFLLMIPVALTFWFRRRAHNTAEEAKPTVVFAYRRFMMATVLGGVLVWWTAIDLLHADTLALRLTLPLSPHDDGFAALLAWVLLCVPPLAVLFVCLLLSPVHSLRGITRTRDQVLSQSFWSVARLAVPLVLLVGTVTEMFYSLRTAIMLLAAWILAARFTRQQAAKSTGTELRAITSGELRDRAFALATKAGAKLNQLYVLPAEQNRMANAFAHNANNIYLTDYLLKNLNRNEVDAVIGHEATHLRKKHGQRRLIIWIVTVAVVAFASGWLQDWIPADIPVGPVLYGAFLLVLFVISRRNEFEADTGAWKLTGDAEAMITALAKISRLNTMPIHWGKIDEKMLTHPSTLRRIKHLARLGNISEARIPELLNQSGALPVDPYPLPSSALSSGKIFSSAFKGRISWRYSWIDALSIASFASVTALIAQHSHLSGDPLYIFLVLGFLLALALHLAISIYCPLMGMKTLEQRLRAKFESDQRISADAREGLLVGLSPGSQPRIYEGNWCWDMGLLYVSDERLCYWGEETRFSVLRTQITSVSLGPGPIGWFNPRSACISWRDELGNAQAFSLRSMRANSILQMSAKTRKLAQGLQNWLCGEAQTSSPVLPLIAQKIGVADTLPEPKFGEVTSTPPKRVVQPNQLTRIFLSNTLIAVCVGILLGLHIPILDDIASSSTPIDLNSSGAAFLYVLVTVWLVRVLQLWPYWRFRESAPSPAPDVPPAPARTAS